MARPQEALVNKYLVDEVTGCWVWQGARNRTLGYGYSWDNELKRKVLAHRLLWVRHRGPIPEGMHLDHLCRNTGCVNPDHLEPVTNAENSRRGAKVKLTPDQLKLIRDLLADGGLRYADIATRAGVKRSMVADIASGRRWA
jgi:hypothetical protein